MKTSILTTAALIAPLIYAAPVDLDARQTRSRQLIESNLFPVLQRYTKFAAASLATFVFGLGNCPTPPFRSRLVVKINNILTDTQVAVFQDDVAKEFIVSFPGSSSVQDFVTDLNFPLTPFTSAPGCNGCRVHQGVLFGWRSVQGDLTKALSRLRAQHGDYSTVVVGHSLGGGLASIAYTDLKANGVPISAAYTMGSLRVGNPAYADFTDSLSGASDSQIGNFFRITHNTDGVPNLPTNAMGFQHTRTEFYQLDDASGTQTAATTFRCYGQEAPDCSLSTANGFINQDHLMYSGVVMVNGDTCNSTD
ncbi:hypothetical protein ACN47E_000001 [Coniothyrium glycines]